MNIKETAAILKIIKVSYPNSLKNISQKDAEEMLEVWAMMFQNDNAMIVTEAVKAVVTTSKFPPSIADVKEKVSLLTEIPEMTEMEAWSIIDKAIRSSAYNYLENFNNLPVTLQKLLGSPKQLYEWATTENINMQVVQSNFMRSYKMMTERNAMIKKMPESCKNIIEKGVDQLCLDALNATEKGL